MHGARHANQRSVPTLPGVQGALHSGYFTNDPLFLGREVIYITLRWALCHLLRHPVPNKGEGGGLAVHGGGGAWAWKGLPDKPLSPIPEPIGAQELTHSKFLTGLWGALMRGSQWELLFLHWEESGLVKLQRSGRKLEYIP